MPSLADCLKKTKLPAGVKSYLRAQARDSSDVAAVQSYLKVVEGNIKALEEGRKAASVPQEAQKSLIPRQGKIATKLPAHV